MKITGEINFFVEDVQIAKDRTIRKLKTNISTKQEDETYIKYYLDVMLSSKNFPAEKVEKLNPEKVYTMNITDGWLNVRSYLDKDENERKVIYIFVNKGKLLSAKDIDQDKRKKALEAYEAKKAVSSDSANADNDLPF